MNVRLILLLLLSCPLWAQCVKQPAVALKGVDEFACRGMSYEQAWDTLSAGGVAPVRPARVAELGMRANRRGRKHILITGLRIASFGLPFVGGLGNISEEWLKGMFAAAPGIIEGGLQLAQGIPDEFQPLPDDAGFVTVYALASNQVIVGQPTALPTAFEPTDPEHLQRKAVETINEWVEEVALVEMRQRYMPDYRMFDRHFYMNQAEAEAAALDPISDYQLVAAK